MDKTEEAENLAQPNNVPSVYPQTSVLKPVNTVLSTYGGRFSASQGLETCSETSHIQANRGFGNDRTKTVIGTGSQRLTAQPEVKFATPKPSITPMARQSW